MKKLNYRIIKNWEYQKNIWSGGTTTQMFIYPENSSYNERNFTWRISSATIDTEISTFSNLSDYNRIIMILSGNIKLSHENHHSVQLNKFEQDRFDGAYNTKSIGKAIDFNLIMKKGKCQGDLESIYLEPKSTFTTIINEENKIEFKESVDVYYNVQATIFLSINESKKITLNKGDLLIIYKNNEKQSILFDSYNSSDESAILIKSRIFY